MTSEDDERLAALRGLGLGDYEARAYAALALVGRGTAREVSERSGVPRTRVYAVLRALAERRLVRVEGDAFAAEPLAPLVEEVGRAAERRRAELLARRDALARAYAPGRPPASAHELRLLRGGARPGETLSEALRGARISVDAAFSAATFAHALAASGVGEALGEALARVPHARLVLHAADEDADALAGLAALAALPRPALERARIAPREWWFFDRIVVDRREALLRFSLAVDGRAAPGAAPDVLLATRSAGLVADAEAAVAHAWALGRPVPESRSGRRDAAARVGGAA